MDSCQDGDVFLTHVPFKTVLLVCHVLTSLLAVLLNIWFWKTQHSKVYFHANLRSIIFLSIWLNIVHSVALIIAQSTHLLLYSIATNGCGTYVPFWYCLLFRGITSITQMAYTPLFVAMIIERAIATANIGGYENSKSRMVYYYLGCMFGSVGFLYLAYNQISWMGDVAYCSAVTSETADGIALTGYVLTGVEAVAILGFFLVLVVNLRFDKRKADLKLKYQVRENLAALKLLVPWTFVHWFIFTFLYASNVLIPIFGTWNSLMNMRTAYAAAYVVPVYCLISPYLLTYIAWKQRKVRNDQLKKISTTPANMAAYENYLKNQWA